MYSFIHFANNLSAWVGKAFAWLIILMTFGISYEVFVRYVLNAPTPLGPGCGVHHVRFIVDDGRRLHPL